MNLIEQILISGHKQANKNKQSRLSCGQRNRYILLPQRQLYHRLNIFWHAPATLINHSNRKIFVIHFIQIGNNYCGVSAWSQHTV